MKQDEERIEYFASSVDSSLLKIIVVAVVFHMLVVGACIAFHYVNLKPEPEMIPVFEMVKIPPTPQPPAPPKTQPPPPKPKPEPPKPKVNKELPPEIKPEPKEKPEEVHEEVPPEPEPPPEEPVDDFPVDDMDLPVAMEAPSLDPVGSVDMDPLMQVYLEQLKKIIMGNFKPPRDLKVDRSAKTTVQFTVDRFGGITGVLLKRSSGNKAWDHLSVRAIQISKVPELPPNYRAPSLVLNFNFTPN
ncbi:energy transducer TonB [Fibrobacter sp. UWP2]|jgi:TonB family protein|uniref:energy transducer TonB n=1 Tax=Fibrobacter sp. UWP2 TaxID=1896216 RepID=UPI0009130637|nr:energy transducer TonB [Fibrobacter sp. UWP2]SHI44262.1 protein TonB [Fibrobacter sp. UWP2]